MNSSDIVAGATVWMHYGRAGVQQCQVRSWPDKDNRVSVRPFDHVNGEPMRNQRRLVGSLIADPGFPLDEDPNRPIAPGNGFWMYHGLTGVRRVRVVAVPNHYEATVELYDHYGQRWQQGRQVISKGWLKPSPS